MSSSLNYFVKIFITLQKVGFEILPEKFLSSFSKADFKV